MAEVVGVVSAGIGIATFALQVNGTIKQLRDIRSYAKGQAGDDVVALVGRLEMLRLILLSIDSRQPSATIDLAVHNCQSAYSKVDTALQQLNLKLAKSAGSGLRGFRHIASIKNDIHDVGRRLDYVIQDLTWLVSHLVSKESSDQEAAGAASIVQASITDPRCPEIAHVNDSASAKRRARAVDCNSVHCHCSCHSTQRITSRLWVFEYTPISTLYNPCTNSKCTATCYRLNLKFSLSKFGIPFRLYTALVVLAGAGRYALRPALGIERVMEHTSPGFDTLFQFQCGRLTMNEAQERFRELKRCDPFLHRHINPDGRNYVQKLLDYGPSSWGHRGREFELLTFFAAELGMTLEGLDQRFLVECARWIGKGPHLDLLQVILAYGFDPCSIDSPAYEEWPSPCSPDWIANEIAPDPFFIEYLAILADASPGFGGLTPLHEMVLLGNPDRLTSFLSRSSFHMEKNFLGQTPLHLAVRDVDMVRLLVDHGHDMDIKDNHGITALMYAAGMGNGDVVNLMIQRRADLSIEDTRWSQNFIGYADARGHWQLIMSALDLIQAIYPPRLFQYHNYWALARLISRETWRPKAWGTYFSKLVSQCSDTNKTLTRADNGTRENNLLHFISHREHITVLVENGFTMFNQANSVGQSAIFSLAPRLDITLTQALMDHGTNVNHVDHDGRTVLFALLGQIKGLNYRLFDIMDSIHICLKAGLDTFEADGCRCPCSPEGCSLPAAFDITFEKHQSRESTAFVWALEFISLIEELKGCDESKRLLLAFLRRNYSDKAEITHVCCHKAHGIMETSLDERQKLMPEDMIDEILDEEDEFIANLEDEMAPMASESLSALRTKWIMVLKERCHERHCKAVNPGDYHKKTFAQSIHGSIDPRIACISDYMADYIIWLEHQYVRFESSGNIAVEKEPWYKRRITWFVELMQIMEVDIETLSTDMQWKVKKTRWRKLEVPDADRIIRHFTASMRALLNAKGGS
ncbi:hypothetical protein BDV19DRAFT_396470 [Aspergillus venezuelensis]